MLDMQRVCFPTNAGVCANYFVTRSFPSPLTYLVACDCFGVRVRACVCVRVWGGRWRCLFKVEEQASLRDVVLADVAHATLAPNATLLLNASKPWPIGTGNQSEINVVFERPTVATTLRVEIRSEQSTHRFYINYSATNPNVTVGHEVIMSNPSGSGSDSDGGDSKAMSERPMLVGGSDTCASPQHDVCLLKSKVYKSFTNTTNITDCCNMCVADAKCVAWNINLDRKICFLRPDYVSNPGTDCISGKVRATPPPSPKPPSPPPPPKGSVDVLRLLPSDTTITLAVYVDGTFAEAYWQDGRVAMTVNTVGVTGSTTAALTAGSGGAVVKSAQAWSVGSIWITADEVLAMPRPDGKPPPPPTPPPPPPPPHAQTRAQLLLKSSPRLPAAPPPLSSRALWVWSGGSSPLVNSSNADAFFTWAAAQDIPVTAVLVEDEGISRKDPAASAPLKTFASEAASRGMGVQPLFGWAPSDGKFPEASGLAFVKAAIDIANEIDQGDLQLKLQFRQQPLRRRDDGLRVTGGLTGVSFDIEPQGSQAAYQEYADFLRQVRVVLDAANTNRIVAAAAAAATAAAHVNGNRNTAATSAVLSAPPQNLTLSIAGSWGFASQNVTCGALGVVSMVTCTIASVDTFILMNYRNNAYGCYCRPPPGKNPPQYQCPADGGPLPGMLRSALNADLLEDTDGLFHL